MKKKLLIVESPAKAKTISKYLGAEFVVIASYGHVRELPRKSGAIEIAKDFNPLYQIIKKNQKHINSIIQAAETVSIIYLATDQDREGESISWHLQAILQEKNILNNKEVCRVSFNEITKSAVIEALTKPHKINMQLVEAQQARLILDYLIGFNISPLLWRKVKAGLSAGRVQSPALRLICERESEIKTFISQDYYSIHLISKKSDISFKAKLVELNNQKIETKSILSQEQAQQIVNDLIMHPTATVKNITNKQVQDKPKPPFITSSLQIEASRKLGFNSNRTMKIAQNLYEGIALEQESLGLITYMRTDCLQISNIALTDIRNFIANNFDNNYLPNKPHSYKNKSKNAQEAHEAIRPTNINLTPDKIKQYLDADQYKLYSLIWNKTVASQMTSAIYDRCIVDITITNKELFRLNGQTLKFDGYTKIFQSLLENDESSTDNNIVPQFTINEKIKIEEINYQQHQTQPKPRFSEASLTKELEDLGIGRPSTWSSIIPTLKKRDYIDFEKKKIIPTDIGNIVNNFLSTHLEKYVNLNFTAHLESDLDDIANSKKQKLPLLKNFWSELEKSIKAKQEIAKSDIVSQKLDRNCPDCNSHLIERLGRYGTFVGCSAYPNCKYIEKSENATKPKVFMQCPVCQKGDIVNKKGRYGVFYSCTNYPSCKTIFKYPPIPVNCAQCQQKVTMLHFTKTKGYRIICPSCKHNQSASNEIVNLYSE